MYYIEFIEKNPGVSQQRFHEVVKTANARWAGEHPDDELVLSIGRTWRMGPKPTYMTIWKVASFAALDRWNGEFHKERIIRNHSELEEVATIVDGGVYEDIGEEVL